METTTRTLRTLVWGLLLTSYPASGEAFYTAQLRWRPTASAGIAGYQVFVRPLTSSYGTGIDVPAPVPSSDGSIAFLLPNLDVRTAYAFVVTAYTGAGGQSAASNELTIGYAQAASVVDSDRDGLTDGAEDRNLNMLVDAGETDPSRPDTDGDSVGDRQDQCRDTAPGVAVDATGCACSQLVCDDGDPCTVDSCGAPVACVHTLSAACLPCTTATACDDANACTTDLCLAGRCSHTAAPDGRVCEDGLYCTVGDHCEAGVCRSGGPNCQQLASECRTPTCDEARRACETTPAPNGLSCGSDFNQCDGTHVCQDGTCMAGPPPTCDDGNACTTDACDPIVGHCTHEGTPGCCAIDADCNDTDACTTNERCVAGHCTSDPLVCAPPGGCLDATCDAQAGCIARPLPDGTVCDDHDPCTPSTTCVGGVCGASAARSSAVEGISVGDLDVIQFSLRPAGKKLRLSAQGRFAAGTLSASDAVSMELHADNGDLLYTTTVPPDAFARRADRALYVAAPGTAPYNGVRRLDLRTEGDAVVVTVRAILPSSVADPLPLVSGSTRAAAKGSGSLAWLLRWSDQCVRDPGMRCTRATGGTRKCR